MEKDDEVKGLGNQYTTEFRQLDPRIGRWFSLDPLMAKYPTESPFNGFSNNPILFPDPTGKEIKNPYETNKNNGEKIVGLKDKISNSSNNKEIRGLKKEINALQVGLDKYYKVESLKTEFKMAVGEAEYNRIDNLNYKGTEINIEINIKNKPFMEGVNPPKLVPQDGETIISHNVLKNTEEWAGLNTNKPFSVILYKADLSTLANELGDCLYGVHNPERQFKERNEPYGTSQTDIFSFDYEFWVDGRGSKPDINNY